MAMKLLEKNLIACANIINNVESIFKWEGKICQENEFIVLLKTIEKNVDAVIKNIKNQHSYDCPAIMVLDIDSGSKEFLKWVNGSCNEEY